MFNDIFSLNRRNTITVSEFIDDELPLPSFPQVFGFSVPPPLNHKSHKRRFSGTEGVDSKNLVKRLKVDEVERNKAHHDSGRWTAEEHRLFLEGVMLYGKDWKKMQPLIKTRTLVQIRTHAQKVFKSIGLKRLSVDRPASGDKISQSANENVEASNSTSKEGPQDDPKLNSVTSSDTATGRAEECENQKDSNRQQLSDPTANTFRGYDMEVTDEEFNLVVQHLKNLGEIRGEDLSDEGDDASIHDLDTSRRSDLMDYQQENNLPGNFTGGTSNVTDLSIPSGTEIFGNTGINLDSTQQPVQQILSLQSDEDKDAEKGRSVAASNSFAIDEDIQNQHLLQTLRQYLMPDNEQSDGFSTVDYFL